MVWVWTDKGVDAKCVSAHWNQTVTVRECRTKWRVQCSAWAVQIREHIPPPVSNVDSILYEHSDVAPSGLVCSFILTIAVYLFKYFCKCWFNNDLFIHLCCIIYVGVFIHYLLSFLVLFKNATWEDFKMVNQEKGISSALLNKGNILQYQQWIVLYILLFKNTGIFLSANIL